MNGCDHGTGMRPGRRSAAACALAMPVLLFLLGAMGAARAQALNCTLPPLENALVPQVSYRFQSPFGQPGDDEARRLKESEDISALACADADDAGWRICLLVADDVRYGHFLALQNGVLHLGATLDLVPSRLEGDKVKEMDAEGAAYVRHGSRGYFYVTGSHGAARGDAAYQPGRFRVVRLLYDPASGSVLRAQTSDKLAPWFLRFRALKPYACRRGHTCKPLDQKGANVEGLAEKDGMLFFGFRAPTDLGMAYVLEIAPDALFGRSTARPRLRPVNLGIGCGVRDLVAVKGGFLVLAGLDVSEQPQRSYRSFIHFWDGRSETVTPLGSLASSDKGGKPEALLVLSDNPGQADYSILVLSDGVAGGAPKVYAVPRR